MVRAANVLVRVPDVHSFHHLISHARRNQLFVVGPDAVPPVNMIRGTNLGPAKGAVLEAHVAGAERILETLPVRPKVLGMRVAVVGVARVVGDAVRVQRHQRLDRLGHIVEAAEMEAERVPVQDGAPRGFGGEWGSTHTLHGTGAAGGPVAGPANNRIRSQSIAAGFVVAESASLVRHVRYVAALFDAFLRVTVPDHFRPADAHRHTAVDVPRTRFGGIVVVAAVLAADAEEGPSLGSEAGGEGGEQKKR